MGLLRIILALSVVNTHAPFSNVPVFLSGGTAVLIFYMISGFYMSLILNGHYSNQSNSLKRFYINRALRIYPTYYLAVAVSFAYSAFVTHGDTIFTDRMGLATGQWLTLVTVNISLIGLDITRMLGAAGYEQAFVYSGYYIPFAWTIGIELTFYLFAPFLTRLAPKNTIILILIGIGVRFVMATFGVDQTVWRYLFSPSVMVFFLIGHASRLAYERLRHFPYIKHAGVFAIIAIVLMFVGTPRGKGGLYGNDMDYWKNWIFYLAMATTLPLLFALTRHSKIDNAIGQLSYPLYLGHLIVIVVANDRNWFPKDTANIWIAVTALFYAWLLHMVAEYPLASLRSKIAGRKKKGAELRRQFTIVWPKPAQILFWIITFAAFYNWLFILYPINNYTLYRHNATQAGEGFWRHTISTEVIEVGGKVPLQLPGPLDGWAGGESKEFLLRLPYHSDTKITFWIRDSHNTAPPILEVSVGEHTITTINVPAGNGGAPHTWLTQGKSGYVTALIPGELLKKDSVVRVRSIEGSWVVFNLVIAKLEPSSAQKWATVIFSTLALCEIAYAIFGYLPFGKSRKSRREL